MKILEYKIVKIYLIFRREVIECSYVTHTIFKVLIHVN